MPEPIPAAAEIAERQALRMETDIRRARPELDPVAVSRAVRSEKGMLATISRATALTARGTHAHLSWWGRQYFPDTAELENLARHASIWGLSSRPATLALGAGTGNATPATGISAGTIFLTSTGISLETTAPATAAGDGAVNLSLRAIVPGPDSNADAGMRISPQGALAGWTTGSGVVASGGIAGGAEAESDLELGVRVMDHIRERPHGGAGFDYKKWIVEAFAALKVEPITDWVGRGSVGVVVAMKNTDGTARSPNQTELDAMADHLGRPGSSTGVRPVTAHVVMVAAVLRTIDASVYVDPPSGAVQTAVTTAFERFIRGEGEIGGTLWPSRISEALSAASGEYRHALTIPAHTAPIVLAPSELPVPGALSFVSDPS